MVGESEVPRWRYNFSCRDCECIKYLDDGTRIGFYCIPIMNNEEPIHADNDRVVRCDRYVPKMEQLCLFDREEVSKCESGLKMLERRLGRLRQR